MKICNVCKTVVEDNIGVCPRCNNANFTPFQTKRCPFCNSDVAIGTVVCPHCHRILPPEKKNATSDLPQASAKPVYNLNDTQGFGNASQTLFGREPKSNSFENVNNAENLYIQPQSGQQKVYKPHFEENLPLAPKPENDSVSYAESFVAKPQPDYVPISQAEKNASQPQMYAKNQIQQKYQVPTMQVDLDQNPNFITQSEFKDIFSKEIERVEQNQKINPPIKFQNMNEKSNGQESAVNDKISQNGKAPDATLHTANGTTYIYNQIYPSAPSLTNDGKPIKIDDKGNVAPEYTASQYVIPKAEAPQTMPIFEETPKPDKHIKKAGKGGNPRIACLLSIILLLGGIVASMLLSYIEFSDNTVNGIELGVVAIPGNLAFKFPSVYPELLFNGAIKGVNLTLWKIMPYAYLASMVLSLLAIISLAVGGKYSKGVKVVSIIFLLLALLSAGANMAIISYVFNIFTCGYGLFASVGGILLALIFVLAMYRRRAE